MTALSALLAGIIDYAGLFPPAALDMPAAVRNYAQYRLDDERWMLGRFVVPVARLDEFRSALDSLVASEKRVRGDSWRIAALLGSDARADIATARAFNATRGTRARIDVIEGKFETADAIASAAEDARRDFTVYAEVSVDRDPTALIDAIAQVKIGAKIRTGGVTSSAFPIAPDIIRFMRKCIVARVPFKATAGLHHPIGGEQRLTYASDAPRGVMYGFLNVFLAAAFLEFGISDADAQTILEEQQASAFEISDALVAWRGRTLTAGQLRVARDVVAVSFGSCSFREPIDELRALSILD